MEEDGWDTQHPAFREFSPWADRATSLPSAPLNDPISLQPARLSTPPLVEARATLCNRALFPPRRSFHYLNNQRGSSLAPTKARPPLYGSPRGSEKLKTSGFCLQEEGEELSEGEGWGGKKGVGRAGDLSSAAVGGFDVPRPFSLNPAVAKLLFATGQVGRYTNFPSSAFRRKGTASAPVKVKKGWGQEGRRIVIIPFFQRKNSGWYTLMGVLCVFVF